MKSEGALEEISVRVFAEFMKKFLEEFIDKQHCDVSSNFWHICWC